MKFSVPCGSVYEKPSVCVDRSTDQMVFRVKFPVGAWSNNGKVQQQLFPGFDTLLSDSVTLFSSHIILIWSPKTEYIHNKTL